LDKRLFPDGLGRGGGGNVAAVVVVVVGDVVVVVACVVEGSILAGWSTAISLLAGG